MSRSGALKRLFPLVVIVGLVVAFFAFGLNRYLTLQALHDNDDALRAFVTRHPLLSPATYVAAYALVVALSVPGGAVMTVTGGWLFGLWIGAALALVGATLGATILFLIARFMVGDALRARAGPFLNRMADGFERNAFAYLLFLRLVPAFPFWAVNLVPALVGMRLRSFAAATVIGIIPGTLAYASVGDGFGLYFEAGSGTPLSAVFSPEMITIRVGLAILALLPIAVRWARKRWNP